MKFLSVLTFIIFAFAPTHFAFSQTCISDLEAREALIQFLENESNLTYPNSFEGNKLVDALYNDGHHYHAQTEFFTYNNDMGSTEPIQGVVIANVSCQGKVQVVFSTDHD